MTRPYLVPVLLIVFMAIAVPATARSAPLEVSCQKNDAPLDGGFCIVRTPESRSQDVLYYLHGRSLNETTWLEDRYYPAQLRKQWSETGRQAPVVVTVSFGPLWALVERNESAKSGLLEYFTQAMMPRIEKALGGLKGRRLLLGESMGGFNSAQLALKTRLFERAAILCAPIMDVSPFAAQAEIDAYIQRNQADPALVNELVRIGRELFPAEEDWRAASPLELAERFDRAGAPLLYIASGFYDAYGTYAANERFAKTLLGRGASVEWRPQWGGHCAIDIPSLADFLTR